MSDASATFIGTATVLLRRGRLTVRTDPNFLHRGGRAYLGHRLWSRRRTEPAHVDRLQTSGKPVAPIVPVSRRTARRPHRGAGGSRSRSPPAVPAATRAPRTTSLRIRSVDTVAVVFRDVDVAEQILGLRRLPARAVEAGEPFRARSTCSVVAAGERGIGPREDTAGPAVRAAPVPYAQHCADAAASRLRRPGRLVAGGAAASGSDCDGPESLRNDLTGPGARLDKSTMMHHFRMLRQAGLTRTVVSGRTHTVELRRDELDARFPGLIDALAPTPVFRRAGLQTAWRTGRTDAETIGARREGQ